MKNILPTRLIEISFYLLFLLVPLVLTPFNFELFEYNKMMLTYFLTVIITASWLLKMVLKKKVIFKRTPLDLPLFIFLISLTISTLFSWDRHVSLFGYYSRFNGGLLSSISYLLLYFAFVSNFPAEKIAKLLKFILVSAFLVSVYGILEHFGIDKNLWVQDVQNRVFSTLGQPNWLAAYLAVLIPISLSFILNTKYQIQNTVLSLVFLTALIFTKSRSGFLGLSVSLFIFWFMQLIIFKRKILKYFLLFTFLLSLITFLLGFPFQQINRWTLPEITKKTLPQTDETSPRPIGSSVIDIGITESGTIRNIVWRGALNIFKNNPFFGTGVETFAFSYFKFRPRQHNMTSEWDFLYNKAHNEYLNYAATTGIFGLGSYLLIILIFSIYAIKSIWNNSLNTNVGLFSAWLSILVTNFFGFSVVIIQLFFFLIPAIIIVLNKSPSDSRIPNTKYHMPSLNQGRLVLVLAIVLASIYLILKIFIFWLADFYFAKGNSASRSQEFVSAYNYIKKAILLNNREPLYLDELAFPAVQIGLSYFSENNATASASFINEAVWASDKALSISPRNVNFWKTRTRILYALTGLDEKYLQQAIESLEKAGILSPTDPKIRYNLALMYDSAGNSQKAYRELEETIRLKINYRDAYLAQAVFYKRDGDNKKAASALNFILTRINPNDEEAKKLLEEIK